MSELPAPAEIGIAFGTAFLTEALTPGKLSTVSSSKSIKDLTPGKFIHATPHITAELINAAIRGYKGEALRLGASVLEITRNTLRNKWVGTNVALGYAILSTSLAYILGKALSRGLALIDLPTLIQSLHPELLAELRKEPSCRLYAAISYSEKHLGAYFGRIPDVRSTEGCREITLLEVFQHSSLDDEVSDELMRCFTRTLQAYALMKSLTTQLGVLEAVKQTHTYLLREHPDTLVTKSRGLPTAYALMKIAGNPLKGRYEQIDRYLRVKGVNPGTTSDITSCALGLLLVERIEAGCSRQ
ncbi:MAG: triphosphoribosyl-dephospho-CoA synthase [Desulfurococcales archaeon]|nr:triphosphoribosyl-dephospho-CoA synthase [Desulfurococcales archaeon]